MTSTNLTTNKFSRSTLLFVAGTALSLLLSCNKNDKAEDTNSLAFKISESEKLAIPASVDLPANPPGGNSRTATFFADGVQKYKSQLIAGSDPAKYEWVFVAPEAELYDANNKMVGTHSAGPAWQLTGSADSLVGQAFSPPKTAASPDPSSIDWLLLMPKTGKTPTGIFAKVSYIQRIDTKGGKAPSKAPESADQTVDVPYTAIYRMSQQN
jgi:hypothetical protein